jgi:4-nitrophenyl phosphatase
MSHELLARLDGLLFDLDGVVYRGSMALPGADQLTATLRRLGIAYAFVTNNATLTPRQYQTKLGHMGVRVHARDIVTSSDATAAYLASQAARGTPVYVVGEFGLRAALRRVGFDVDGARPQYVVVGLDRHVTYARLAGACIAIQQGAALVATNADPAIPVEQGLWPGAGSILSVITTATRATPVVIGKPEPTLVNVALGHIGVAKERAAMVGDQIETDIRAGRAAGVATILVQGDLAARATEPQPDLVVRDVEELLNLLTAARS